MVTLYITQDIFGLRPLWNNRDQIYSLPSNAPHFMKKKTRQYIRTISFQILYSKQSRMYMPKKRDINKMNSTIASVYCLEAVFRHL